MTALPFAKKFKTLKIKVDALKTAGVKVLAFCYPAASSKCNRFGLVVADANDKPYIVFNTKSVDIAIAVLESWGL